MIRPLAIVLCTAAPAVAQDQVPAPEYFVRTAMEVSTAQQLAVSCATLSIHLGKASIRSQETLVQLTKDGFDPENLAERMADPSAEIAVLQQAFVEKHGLAGAITEEMVCAAGQLEIAEATGIGALLIGEAQ